MTSKAAQRPRSRRLLAWSWVPAVIVTAFTILTAAGISLVPTATGASGQAPVEAQVVDALNVSLAGCSGPLDMGALSLAATVDTDTAGDSCTVEFSTNDDDGARIDVSDNDNRGGNFFCDSTNNAACDDPASLIGEGAGAGPYAINTADSFGAALIGVGGDGRAVWNINDDGFGARDYSANWYGVLDAASEACDSNTDPTVSTTCDFTFGARMGADNAVGTAYEGTVLFEAVNE